MNTPMIAQFDGLNLSIIDHAGQKWLTAEQVGLALGYSNDKARTGITNLYNRHQDEFTDQDTFVIKLMANPQGGNPNTRIFSASGCNLLAFFSNTPRAKEFRAWAKQVLAGAALPAPAPQRNRSGGKVLITRELEHQLLCAFVQSTGPQAQLARDFGISVATVNMLVHGKYQFSPAAGRSLCSPELLDLVAERVLAHEQNKLLAYQQSLAARLRNTANNVELANRIDAVGQHLQQPLLQALLPLNRKEV